MNLLEAMADEHLFARWFRDRDTWAAWRAFIAALFAHSMSDEELALYRQCTGRETAPVDPFREAWLVCGRRGGKSFIMALLAVYLAAFREYRIHLVPGERATVMVIAQDRKQARTIIRYVRAMLVEVPMLARLVERSTIDAFDLTNFVTIEVGTASYRSVRGYTVAAALCDELAFWPTDDAAEPDYAILDALRPAMATIPTAMLLCASSPYARRGALWDAYRRHHGKDDAPVLVWQAATRTMNPTVPQREIDEAMERDPASNSAEYLAQFRTDVEALLTREAVEGCVSLSVRERAPVPGVTYHAFVDPSGGSADSMTMAVGHREKSGTVVVDAIRERKPPFSPEQVVQDFAGLLKSYRITKVSGDRYAGEWPREQFRKAGVSYEPSEKTKSDLYRDLVPTINSGMCELLDEDRLINQLVGLERRTARGGRDTIDHAPGQHDDVANAVAGVLAMKGSSYTLEGVGEGVARLAQDLEVSSIFANAYWQGRSGWR